MWNSFCPISNPLYRCLSLVFGRVLANKWRRHFVGDPGHKQCSSGAELTNVGREWGKKDIFFSFLHRTCYNFDIMRTNGLTIERAPQPWASFLPRGHWKQWQLGRQPTSALNERGRLSQSTVWPHAKEEVDHTHEGRSLVVGTKLRNCCCHQCNLTGIQKPERLHRIYSLQWVYYTISRNYRTGRLLSKQSKRHIMKLSPLDIKLPQAFITLNWLCTICSLCSFGNSSGVSYWYGSSFQIEKKKVLSNSF